METLDKRKELEKIRAYFDSAALTRQMRDYVGWLIEELEVTWGIRKKEITEKTVEILNSSEPAEKKKSLLAKLLGPGKQLVKTKQEGD